MPDLPELNPVDHGRLRLALLSVLTGAEEAESTWLSAKTESTDGNLGAQLLKLEEAGYVVRAQTSAARFPAEMMQFIANVGHIHLPNQFAVGGGGGIDIHYAYGIRLPSIVGI